MQQYRDSDAMALTLFKLVQVQVPSLSTPVTVTGPSNGHGTGPSTSNPACRTQSRCVGGQGLRLSACVRLRGTGTPLVCLLQVLSAASLNRRGLLRVVHLPYINNGRSISHVLNFKSRQNGKETDSRCYRCLRQNKAGGAAGPNSCSTRNDAGIHG